MSMKGITMSPRMMNVGSTTPACQGSKKTSISCSPRKYHGAFDGFGVRVGLAGSSSGASTSNDQTVSRIMIAIDMRNSLRTRCGHVWILSSPGPVAFLMGTSMRLPGTAFSSGIAMASLLLALGRPPRGPEDEDDAEYEEERDGEHAGAREHEREHDQDDGRDASFQLRGHPPNLECRPREPVAPDAPEVDRE